MPERRKPVYVNGPSGSRSQILDTFKTANEKLQISPPLPLGYGDDRNVSKPVKKVSNLIIVI